MEFRAFDLKTKELIYPCESERGFYFFEEEGIRNINPEGVADGNYSKYIIDWQIPLITINKQKVFINDVIYYDGEFYLINTNWHRIDAFDVLGFNFPFDHYDDYRHPNGSRVLNSGNLKIVGNIHKNPNFKNLKV